MDPLDVSVATTAVVAVVALAIALGAWRALVRTGNRSIRFVVSGFLVLAVKSGIKAYSLPQGLPEAAWFELAFSLMDLFAVTLIAWPLFAGTRGDVA